VGINLSGKPIAMKNFLLISFISLIFAIPSTVFAQAEDSSSHHKWHFDFETNLYLTSPSFIVPIFTVDKGNIHLEKRYNYESLKTGSIWFGYNLKGGNDLNYIITPMLGGLIGRIDGVAGGLEITLNYFEFQLYSEMEYVFDFKSSSDNFFYNWTDLTYTPLSWLWAGLSVQRSRNYQTNSDFQWGLFAGGGYYMFGLSCYFYNPGTDDFYTILTLDINF